MVTESQLEELIYDCPTLYHMAESGAWPSIEKQGLLSTTALLELYNVTEPQKSLLNLSHRPESVKINCTGLPGAVIRDQKPMSDDGLKRALPERLSPPDWYRLLNEKVFFWLSKERLFRLTGAVAYQEKKHDVLEIDTESLVKAHFERIWLCPFNSGCTKPFPNHRDESIFSRIGDYPYAKRRKMMKRGDRAVELAVDKSVLDISQHVKRVVSMRGTEELTVIHEI